MKKYNYVTLLLLPLFLFSGLEHMKAQTLDMVTQPIASPSMAAMSKNADVPVSLPTGMPSIQFPVSSLSASDNFGISLGLLYNANSFRKSRTVSDVGGGWIFNAGGVIYKKVVNKLVDESYDNASSSNYRKNEFDDIYYYNLPGYSGKFMIKRDTVNNTFTTLKLSADNLGISYEKENTTATLKVKNFTITDGKGYKYIFNTVNINRYQFADTLLGIEYHSAYLLSEIRNPSGVVIMTFNYDKKDKYMGNDRVYETYRLNSIHSSYGEIALEYSYDENLISSVNDPYSLQNVIVKNSLGEIINSYSFNYSMSSDADVLKRKRILNYIEKQDRNKTNKERTSFIYSSATSTAPGVLEKIVFPQGGVSSYEYEKGEQFFDFNDPNYLASLENYGYNPDIQFEQSLFTHTANIEKTLVQQTLSYPFSISGDTSKQKRYILQLALNKSYSSEGSLPELPTLPGMPKPTVSRDAKYTLKKGTKVLWTFTQNAYTYNENIEFYNTPGSYTLEMVLDAGVSVNGTYGILETKFRPQPYRNAIKTGDYRLKSTKNYISAADTNPIKTINYEYDSFDLINSTSGYQFIDEDEDTSNDKYTMYKNVKVSETQNGYTKYVFLNPDDYPKQQTGGTALEPEYFWPNYNVSRGGMILRKEIYNEQNVIQGSENYTYELEDYFNDQYNVNKKITSRTAYIKRVNTSTKNFRQNGASLETRSESLISKSNLSPSYIKETTASGDIMEKQIIYAPGTAGYSHLENAHIISEPVQTISKKNGKVISNSQVKFDNNSLLPTSLISINPNDNSIKTVLKYDAYDAKGNIRQFSAVSDEASGKGFPTTLIWGYNDTYPIAKIEGATISDIGTLASDIITKSNADGDENTEKALIQSLDAFRTHASLKNFQITTQTYNPMIGITTRTTPDGMREIYKYDSSNRLQYVLDVNGNILKNYHYNVKPQP
ncbi:hypothetical protein [Chryseobacterium sp. CT-SW4]|uniref:hypothetical protein n=1 Tax=Chryseobacterium sp. SW-1 TaxID=3157343 RepID=UPI003B02B52E